MTFDTGALNAQTHKSAHLLISHSAMTRDRETFPQRLRSPYTKQHGGWEVLAKRVAVADVAQPIATHTHPQPHEQNAV